MATAHFTSPGFGLCVAASSAQARWALSLCGLCPRRPRPKELPDTQTLDLRTAGGHSLGRLWWAQLWAAPTCGH